MKPTDFVHLHNHTEYSLLDGMLLAFAAALPLAADAKIKKPQKHTTSEDTDIMPDTELIDIPTAGILEYYGLEVKSRFFSDGGVIGGLGFGVLPRLNLGASITGEKFIGTADPMGSVVGSIYASGTPLSKLRQIGSKVSFSNVSNFGSIGVLNLIVHDKLLSSRKMEDFLNQIISDKTFEQTKIPFSCSAADVKTGEKIVFNSGPIAIAVRASMFLEDDDPARASDFYNRGVEFTAKNGDVSLRFWNAFCRAGYIQLNLDKPAAIAELPKVDEAADYVLAHDPSFYYNSAYTIKGALLSARPKMLGGDPDKAKAYFDKALAGEGYDFLPNRYVMAGHCRAGTDERRA